MLCAKDVMMTGVITVRRNTPVYEVMELFIEKHITGVPVVEDDMTLAGIISEKDIMCLFYPTDGEEEKTVGDFMTQPAIFFDQDESLLDVCDCLMGNDFRKVPIVADGKVVGVISRPDIIKYILQLREEDKTTGSSNKRPVMAAVK